MKFRINPVSGPDLGKDYIGDKNFQATFIAGLSEADDTCITLYKGEDPSYLAEVKTGILIVNQCLKEKIVSFKSHCLVFSSSPKFDFINIISSNYTNRFTDPVERLVFPPDVIISGQTFIEPGVRIGPKSLIYPNVTLFDGTEIGQNCIIQSGCIIGGIGLGHVPHDGEYHRFVHLGNVKIGNNVDLGNNVTVLKAMMETTEIGDGTKIGSQVNIGHNAKIGKNCYISSGTTIGGACTIEDNTWVSIGATIVDHIFIGKNSKIGAGAVVVKDCMSDSLYLGNPARRICEHKPDL